MQLLKRISKNWLIIIVIWLVAFFFALTKLPNVTNLITNYGQPQFSNSSQIIKAEQLQHNWGRNVSNSTVVNVVYNNPSGKITPQQQIKINAAINKLQNNRSLGIQKITTINNSPNGRLPLFSNDQTTQIVAVNVDKQYNTSNTAVNKLQAQMDVTGLNTYVTSPAIVNNINVQKVATISKMATIIIFAIAIILTAIYFRSLVAPVIAAITLGIAYITSLSSIGNLTIHKGLAFSEYTPLLITLIIAILGSIFNFMLLKAISNAFVQYRDSFNATFNGIKKVAYPIIATSVSLAIGFGLLFMIPFSPIKALGSLSISFIILMVAVLTIGPFFTSLLGPEVIWPNKHPLDTSRSKFWQQLGRLSLWQPIIGLLLVAYIVGPFAYSYRNNITYSNLDAAKSNQQAIVGARILQAHFSQGKATPVTIYLHHQQPLNQQASLEQIDSLTNKLKSLPNVNAVYSVTQPSGIPINKYYVQSQLNSISKRIDQSQVKLSQTIKRTQAGHQTLKTNNIQTELATISQLQTATETLINDNQKLATQLASAASHTSISSRQATNKNVRNYQRQLETLKQTLSTASSSLNSIQAQGQQIAASSSRLSTKVTQYTTQLQKAKSIFSSIGQATKATNQRLNSIYNYLDGVAKSSVGAVYYITPTQLADTDFQQSLYNYNSSDNKTTQLSVILQNDPTNAEKNGQTINAIQKDIDVMLQGTGLADAQVAISGQPAQQATLQTNFVKYGKLAGIIIIAVMFLCLSVISRAILNPFYWMVTLTLSLIAGLQVTKLTNHFMFGINQTSWSAIIISTIVLSIISFGELISIAVKYRNREQPFYQSLTTIINNFGGTAIYITGFTIISAIGLLAVDNQVIRQVGITIGTGILLFNISMPIIAIALAKLAEQLPMKKRTK